jgi:hypothetical protein
MVETVPNAVRSGVAHVGVEVFEGTSFVTGRGGVSEELPELSCAEEEPFDFVGEPNAEGSSTALVSSSVATEDTVGTNGLAARVLALEGLNESMSIERPDVLAVRAGVSLRLSSSRSRSTCERQIVHRTIAWRV